MSGLPKNRSAESMQDEFNRFVIEHFGREKVNFTYVVSNYTRAFKVDLKLKQYQGKLWHYMKLFQE